MNDLSVQPVDVSGKKNNGVPATSDAYTPSDGGSDARKRGGAQQQDEKNDADRGSRPKPISRAATRKSIFLRQEKSKTLAWDKEWMEGGELEELWDFYLEDTFNESSIFYEDMRPKARRKKSEHMRTEEDHSDEGDLEKKRNKDLNTHPKENKPNCEGSDEQGNDDGNNIDISFQRDPEEVSERDLQEAVFAFDAFLDLGHGDRREAAAAKFKRLEEKEKESLQGELKLIHSDIKLQEVYDAWERLSEDKATILENFSKCFRSAPFKTHSGLPGAGFSRFQVGGAGSVREAMLVPSSKMVTPKDVKDALKHWKLEPPEMVLQFDLGTRHPGALATKELLELPAFEDIVETVTQSVKNKMKRSERYGGETGLTDGDIVEAVTESVKKKMKRSDSETAEMDDHRARLQKEEENSVMNKIMREVMDAVLQASSMASNWILFDRRTGSSSSSAAELLVEQLSDRKQLRPKVLVFENIARYSNFKPSFAVNRQLLVLLRIASMRGGAGDDPGITKIPKLYDVEDFEKWEPYHWTELDENIADKSEEKEQMDIGNRRLPRKPEQEMIAVDITGKQIYIGPNKNRPKVTPESKWVFHYRQYFYTAGTHFVIFQDAAQCDFPFSVRSGQPEWPKGCVFANGGNLTFSRLQEHLRAGSPSVLLFNTGGVTQTFGSLYKSCVIDKKKHQRWKKNGPLVQQILDKTEVTSLEPWTRSFGTDHVRSMMSLEERAPSTMRQNIVLVDVLKESVEQVVDKLTACFASSTSGLPELGLGTARQDVVFDAWNRAIMLHRVGGNFKTYADRFYYASVLLALLACILAIISEFPDEHFEEHLSGLDAKRGLSRVLLVLPLLSGMFSTIMSERRFLQKWASLHTASWVLVSEIYKFRTRVGEYSEFPSPAQDNEDDSGEEEAHKDSHRVVALNHNPRTAFVKRVNHIFSYGVEPLVEFDALGKLQVDIHEPGEQKKLRSEIAQFMDTILHPVPATRKRAKDAPQTARITSAVVPATEEMLQGFPIGLRRSLGDSEEEDAGQAPHQEDDFVSDMFIEGYLEKRLKVVIMRSRRLTPPLVWRLKCIKVLSTLLVSSGSLLVVFNLNMWVTFTVALATAISNVAQYQTLAMRIMANNNLVSTLEQVKAQLHSLSVVNRRSREMITHCVSTTETSLLSTITAWTGLPIDFGLVGEHGGTSGDGDGKTDKKDGKSPP